MAFTIGIGLLLDDDGFNAVRALELSLASATGNQHGLRQPPHVTVKRPCAVDSIADVARAREILEEIAAQAGEFKITYQGTAAFGTKVLYLRTANSAELKDIHAKLLTAFEAAFPGTTDRFEGTQMVFHTTLGMELSEAEYAAGHELLTGQLDDATHMSVRTCSLGLFLGMDSDTNWIVIAKAKLE